MALVWTLIICIFIFNKRDKIISLIKRLRDK